MSSSGKDTLFNVETVQEDFVFNNRVVEVFDDMIDRSIPFYQEVIQSTARLLSRLLDEGNRVYDLGCATGSSLIALSRHLQSRELSFIGIDNSPFMLEKARLKAELHSSQERVHFFLEDITTFDHRDADAVILNYTLQFIRPPLREGFIKRLCDSLRPGGILILSEKNISHDHRFNREFIDIYHQFKKSKGYSELEIAKKREALENVLVPFSVEENINLLTNCGFSSVEIFFKWFNFSSLVAIKADQKASSPS